MFVAQHKADNKCGSKNLVRKILHVLKKSQTDQNKTFIQMIICCFMVDLQKWVQGAQWCWKIVRLKQNIIPEEYKKLHFDLQL
jgi:hypothetical protein